MAALWCWPARYVSLMPTNKSLGQHWLRDRTVLAQIAHYAQLSRDDTVLEVGPGLGTLTSELLRQAGSVTAVEFDEALATKLPGQFPGTHLTVVHQDILQFDLSSLPAGYKVVANVPYYITSKIVQRLLAAENKPSIAVLLVQKEVAERLAAEPGQMSLLALSAQLYAEVSLGEVVPAELFTPPPKVDSQTVVLRLRDQPLVLGDEQRALFRLARMAFAGKRKKLRTSLASGLRLDKQQVEQLLERADISPDSRPQDLSIDDWRRLTTALADISDTI